MRLEREILNKLLDKYERSKAFMTGESSRRIMIDVAKDAELAKLCEDYDDKKDLLAALRDLRGEGVLDYSWVKYEEENLIDRVWLITEPEMLARSYRLADRIPKSERLRVLEDQAEKALKNLKDQKGDPAIALFLSSVLEECRNRKKIPAPFSTDSDRNQRLLHFLCAAAENRDEQMERVLSNHLFGDSKYFEHELKSSVVSILRKIAQERGEDPETDEEVLLEWGITRWPEVMEFRGPVKVIFRDGESEPQEIDYSAEQYGAYINTDSIRHISSVSVGIVHRVITIENKANYIWYLRKFMEPDQLVIYHGGCFSPMKGLWMKMLHSAARQKGENPTSFYHWSDIDAGGFRIFTRLRDEIIPELQPYCMDGETLRKFSSRCTGLESEHYRKVLSDMRADPRYGVFHDTIDYMLACDCRLEQEAEI